MKTSPERTALAVLIALGGLAAIGLALAASWPAGRPFPPLAYQVVGAGTARLALVALGAMGLVTSWLVKSGARAGWYLMLAGLAWDAVCEGAGLSNGQPSAGLLLGVDGLLLAYVGARSSLFDA